MQKIIVVSDIHINSYGSEKKAFLEFISTLKCDLLVINGDLFDLYLGKVDHDLLRKLPTFVYIKGNHDQDIDKCLGARDSYEIDDILIIHGHQFDWMIKIPRFTKTVVRARYYIESTFKFNIKKFLMRNFSSIVTYLLSRAQTKAKLAFKGKRVIIGHTHLPICEDGMYNSGGFIDGITTYMELTKINNNWEIELKCM